MPIEQAWSAMMLMLMHICKVIGPIDYKDENKNIIKPLILKIWLLEWLKIVIYLFPSKIIKSSAKEPRLNVNTTL